MKGIATFAAGAAVVVSLIATLNWWLDPLGQFWDGEVLRAADARDCVISDDLVGASSWLPFKEDVHRLRSPTTVVVGTSRVLMLDEDDRSFANLGMPGTGIETLAPLFRRLHEIGARRLTVYLGVDLFWLNPAWQPNVVFEQGMKQDVKYVLARQTLSSSVRLLREAPSALVRAWEETSSSPCVIDRGGRAAGGEKDAWEPNGSFVYRHELGGQRIVDDEFSRDLVRFDGPYYRDWDGIDEARLEQLESALELAASYGWRVVGFTSPYSSRYARRLTTARETAPRVAEVARVLPTVFARNGFRYLDWRTFKCADDEYVDDGWHPDEECAARVLATLEDADVPR